MKRIYTYLIMTQKELKDQKIVAEYIRSLEEELKI
jgi:hypothetical protein